MMSLFRVMVVEDDDAPRAALARPLRLEATGEGRGHYQAELPGP